MKGAFGILFMALFLTMLGVGIIIPVLPFYAVEVGANAQQLGFLMATYSLMQFFTAPLWGSLSDRIGRKPVFLIGLAGFSLSFVLFGLVHSLPLLFAARTLAGLLSSATLPTAKAMIADMTGPAERGKGMGLFGAAMGLGFIFGPAAGGILSRWGLSTPFFVSAALAGITFLLALRSIRETLTPENRQPATAPRESRLALWRGPLGPLYGTTFVTTFALAGVETTLALLAKDRFGLDPQSLGLLLLVMGLVGAMIQGGLIGKLIRAFGEEPVLRVGLVVSAAALALISLAGSTTALTAVMALFGVGQGLMQPTLMALVSKRSPVGQGLALGVMDSTNSLGRVAGPTVAGFLYLQQQGAPYLLGAVLTLAALLAIQNRESPRQSAPL